MRHQPVRVLVVEDDLALRQAIASIARHSAYDVTVVADGQAAVQALQSTRFDVVLLDIGLPLVDGWQVLARLAGKRLPSVIVISARGDAEDKVRALDMGADDYLAKPFEAEELMARIRAVLRRAEPRQVLHRVVRCGDVAVDLANHAVFKGRHEVRLSPTEYLLVAELAAHGGEVLPHRALLQHVWGPTYGDELNYLRTFVQRLRSKLEHDPHNPEVIVTVGTRGYRFGPAASTPPAENR